MALTLKSVQQPSIVDSMKRIAIVAVGIALLAGAAVRAQDASTEERFNKLSGQIEDLRANQESLTRKIEALAQAIEGLRGQVNKPAGNYASDEDLKRLAEAVK
jgi:outer membrane murein-binding lipoprotein Lpp